MKKPIVNHNSRNSLVAFHYCLIFLYCFIVCKSQFAHFTSHVPLLFDFPLLFYSYEHAGDDGACISIIIRLTIFAVLCYRGWGAMSSWQEFSYLLRMKMTTSIMQVSRYRFQCCGFSPNAFILARYFTSSVQLYYWIHSSDFIWTHILTFQCCLLIVEDNLSLLFISVAE